NERKNVVALQKLLEQFNEFEGGGKVSPLQVDQVKIQLLQGQNTVLQRQVDLRDSLDRFKLQLGVPVNTLLDLDAAPLQPMLDHLAKIEDVFDDSTASLEELKKFGVAAEAGKLRASLRKYFTETRVVEGTPFRVQFNARWDEWAPAKLNDKQLAARL